MASPQECRLALDQLAQTLTSIDADTRKKIVRERTVSVELTDLAITYAAKLGEGGLHDIASVTKDSPRAQIRLSMSSDDLLELTNRQLTFAKALASGRVTLNASITDLFKIRSLF